MSSSEARSVSAVFFDAGHTLLHPVRPVVEVYFERALRIAAGLDEAAFRNQFSNGWGRLIEDFRSKHPDGRTSEELEREAWHDFTLLLAEPFDELRARHADWLSDLVAYFDHPHAWEVSAEAHAVIDTLRGRGLAIAIVSNWHSALEGILAHHGLADVCDGVVISSQVGFKKPHPKIFTSALDGLGVSAGEAVHVGDSWDEDVEGAISAGLTPVYLDRSGNCPKARPGVLRVQSLDEILSLPWCRR